MDDSISKRTKGLGMNRAESPSNRGHSIRNSLSRSDVNDEVRLGPSAFFDKDELMWRIERSGWLRELGSSWTHVFGSHSEMRWNFTVTAIPLKL